MDPRTKELVRALQRSPHDLNLLQEVREHLVDLGKYGSLAKLLGWWTSRAPSVDIIAQAYLDTGDAIQLRGGQGQRAVWFYARALEHAPTSREAYERLETLLSKSGDNAKLAEVLASQAHALETGGHEPTERAAVYARLGRIRRDRLRDVDGAIDAMQRAHVAAPADRTITEELARLHVARAELSQDGGRAQTDRRDAAGLYTTLARAMPAAEAMRFLGLALDHAPAHAPALDLLEKLATANHKEAVLVERWRAFVDNASPGAAVDRRRRQLARAYASMGKLAEATSMLQPLATKKESPARRAITEIENYEKTGEHLMQPVAKKRRALSARISEILSALEDDPLSPSSSRDHDSTGTYSAGRSPDDDVETRVADPDYPMKVAASHDSRPKSLPPRALAPDEFGEPTAPRAPARQKDALLDEAPTRVKYAPGEEPERMLSESDLISEASISVGDDTVREMQAAPEPAQPAPALPRPTAPPPPPRRDLPLPHRQEPEPEREPELSDEAAQALAALEEESFTPPPAVAAIDEPMPLPRPAPAAAVDIPPAAPLECPPDGFEPQLWEGDEEEEDEEPEDEVVEFFPVEQIVDGEPEPPRRGADGKGAPIVEVVRFRSGKVLEAKALHRTASTFGSKKSPLTVRKWRHGATVKIREPGKGWLRRAGADAQSIDAATSRIKLNVGDSAEISHDGIMSRVRVLQPGVAPVTETVEVNYKLYGQVGGISFGVHLFFVLVLFALNQMGVSFKVEQKPREEIFAEARLKEKKKKLEDKKKKKKPRKVRKIKPKKIRKLPEKMVADRRIRIPKKARKLLKNIEKSRGGGDGGKGGAGKAVTALTSPYSGDGQTINDVVTNIDALAGGQSSGAYKVGGTLAHLEGGGVNIGTGGGGDIGTLGGQVASKDAGKLKSTRKGGKTRGRVKGIKALTKVQGNLSKGEVLGVINRNMHKIQRCYEKALIQKPNLSGKVEFEWTIKVNGSVTGVRRLGNTLGEASVASCVARVLKGLKFPKPRGGPVTVKFPFMFQRVP